MVKTKSLCEICLPKQWKTISTDMLTDEGYPVYGANGVIGFYSEYNHKEPTLLITCRGATCGTLNICEPYSYVNGNAMALDNLTGEVDIKYLYYFLLNRGFDDVITGSAQPQIVRQSLQKVSVTYPDLEKQAEIVSTLEKISMLITMRKEQLAQLDELVKARFVEMFGDPLKNDKGLPTVSGEVLFKLSNGKALPNSKRFAEGIPAYGGNGISWYTDEILCDYDTIIVGRVGFQSGNVHLAKAPLWVTDNAMYISSINSRDCDIRFLCDLMEHLDFTRYQDAGDLKKITQKPFMQMQYLMPPMPLQKQYIAFAEQGDKLKLTIQASLDKLEIMKKALMQEYFG